MNKEILLFLVGKVIKVNRGGPESRTGKLLAVGEDYLTLLTEEDGVIYYQMHHIKSITDNAKNKVELELELEIPEDFEFLNAQDFKGVFQNLKFRWIQINRGGPEKLEGVMDEVNDDFITIIANEEVIRIAVFHIHNISYGMKVEKPEDQEKTKEDGNKNKKEKDNKNNKDNSKDNKVVKMKENS